MNLPSDYSDRIGNAIRTTGDKIQELLRARLVRANAALESLADHGPGTGEEAAEKVTLLYEFWAVSRALGAKA
jgi:hypothetical protein